MNCYTKDELQSFLLEELSAESEPALVEHLEGCAACQQMLDDLSDDQLVRSHLEAMLCDDSMTLETARPQNPTTSGGGARGC